MTGKPFEPGREKTGGRRTGSRNKLSTSFLEAFAADFEQHGAETIKIVRMERPNEYLKVAAYLMPKAFDDEMPPILHIVTGVPRWNDEPVAPQLPSSVVPLAPPESAPVPRKDD